MKTILVKVILIAIIYIVAIYVLLQFEPSKELQLLMTLIVAVLVTFVILYNPKNKINIYEWRK